MESTACATIAFMLSHLARPGLERDLSQLVSTAHRRAALPRRKSELSLYVLPRELNSHLTKRSNTIAVTYLPGMIAK